MSINPGELDEDAIRKAIASALELFYDTLVRKIDSISINELMKRKNPYLYRAKAVQTASDIVESVLSATISSSEETIFGNCFFEPLAIAASGGQKALAEGIDIMVQNDARNEITAIAVKSGTAVFNSDSKKKQEQSFTAASKLAGQAKKAYRAIIGYGYGRKMSNGRGRIKLYEELAGQKFWKELTGDSEFYIKIIEYMGKKPEEYINRFKESYARASNRLVRDFLVKFCDDNGQIDWVKLLEFNSAENQSK